MQKPISTRTHGLIDYAYGAALVAAPFLFRWGPEARRLSLAAGVATLAASAMTNYEYGLVPVLSMRTHLALDGAETSMLMSAPARLGSRDRSAAWVLALMGGAGAVVGALTQTRSPRELPPRPAWA